MLRNSIPIRAGVAMLLWSGAIIYGAEQQVMIAAQFKAQTKSGEDVLTAPRVITLSGRQAVISVLEQMEMAGLLKSGSTNPLASPGAAGPKSNGVATRKIEAGVSLDITPFVKAGRIEYHGTATVKSFLGYQGDKENVGAEFVTREIHFSGVADDHGIRSLKLKGEGQANAIELMLTFHLVKPDGTSAVRKTGLLRR